MLDGADKGFERFGILAFQQIDQIDMQGQVVYDVDAAVFAVGHIFFDAVAGEKTTAHPQVNHIFQGRGVFAVDKIVEGDIPLSKFVDDVFPGGRTVLGENDRIVG